MNTIKDVTNMIRLRMAVEFTEKQFKKIKQQEDSMKRLLEEAALFQSFFEIVQEILTDKNVQA